MRKRKTIAPVVTAFTQVAPAQVGRDVPEDPMAALAELLKQAAVVGSAYHALDGLECHVETGAGQSLYVAHERIWKEVGHLLLQAGMVPVSRKTNPVAGNR